MSDALYVLLCLILLVAAALYGAALGVAAAGERVPYLSAMWDYIVRPIDAATRYVQSRVQR